MDKENNLALPNVKAQRWEWLARLVRLGARCVTTTDIRCSAWLGSVSFSIFLIDLISRITPTTFLIRWLSPLIVEMRDSNPATYFSLILVCLAVFRMSHIERE